MQQPLDHQSNSSQVSRGHSSCTMYLSHWKESTLTCADSSQRSTAEEEGWGGGRQNDYVCQRRNTRVTPSQVCVSLTKHCSCDVTSVYERERRAAAIEFIARSH